MPIGDIDLIIILLSLWLTITSVPSEKNLFKYYLTENLPTVSDVNCTLPEPDRLLIGEALVPNRLSGNADGLAVLCPLTAGEGGNSLRVTG